jgi:hypothetical protein
MRNSQLGVIGCLATLFISCAPLVRTHSTPRGPKISADCFKIGDSTIVSLSIQRKEGASPWKAEFIGDSPESLITEDIPNLTIIKWKMDLARTKGSSIKPYKMNIQNGDNSYETTVSFRTNSQQIISALVISAVLH